MESNAKETVMKLKFAILKIAFVSTGIPWLLPFLGHQGTSLLKNSNNQYGNGISDTFSQNELDEGKNHSRKTGIY